MVLLRKNVEERIESLRADPIGSPTTLPKLSTHAVLPITIQRNEGSELDIEVNPDSVVQIKKHWYYPLTALEILSPLLSLVFLPIFLNVIKISPQPSISSTVPGLSYFAWSTSESYVELQKTTFDLEDYHPTNVDIGLYALCLALSFITGFLHYKSRQSPMLKNVLIRILIKLFVIIVYTAMLKIPAYSKIVVLTTLAAVTAASVPILMYILKKLVFSKYAIGKTKHVSVKDLVDNYIHTQVLKAMKAGQEQYAYSIDRPSHPTFRVYENILESIDKSFEVWQARKRMLKLYKKGKIYYMVFAAFLVFLAVSNFLVEFLKILNRYIAF
ncbi:hypothetical protein BKA69DRAFT_513088 [Paraphysoderma sedebokerense]|nr:hypothetical protein BKA69DRAFT_513088 [Paraphysoderma sedebokerense]